MASYTLTTGAAKDFPTVQGKLESFASGIGNTDEQKRAYRLAQTIKRMIHEQWDDAPNADFDTVVTVTDSVIDIVVTKS